MIDYLLADSTKSDMRHAISAWVAEQLWPGASRHFGFCTALGVFENSSLIAGIVYHNYDPDADVIEYSGAAINRRWLTRPVLHQMFAYPFDELGCQMVVCRVSEHNKQLHRQLRAFGHSETRLERLRGRDEAEIVFTLTDDAWRANKFMRGQENG